MPIYKDSYKTLSLSRTEDFLRGESERIEGLNDVELLALYEAMIDPEKAGVLSSHEYDREIVDIETWLDDPYFMGEVSKSLYPLWREDLIEMFGSGLYSTAILTGSTGCLGASELVMMASGEMVPAESLATRVWEPGLLCGQAARGVGMATGLQKTIRVVFGNGFWTRCTADHKWMTQDGWVQAKDLRPGHHRLKTPRTWRTQPTCFDVGLAEAEWVGMMTADGNCRETHGNRFSKDDDGVIARFLALSAHLGITCHEGVSNSKARTIECHSMSYDLVAKHGLRWRHSWDKEVSAHIMRSPNETVAAYLRGLFLDASWTLSSRSKRGGRTVPGVVLSLANERLIKQVVLLLKRFGIRAKLRTYRSDRPDEREMWICEVKGVTNLKAFDAWIGCPVDKHVGAWRKMMGAVGRTQENSNADLLPLTWAEAGEWVKRLGIERLARSRYGCWCKSRVGMIRLVSHKKMAEFLAEHPEAVASAPEVHFDPEVFWESVDDVVDDERLVPTYDLAVPDHNRYLANGAETHNTGKSFFSQLVILRMVYEASCLKDPARSYGLATGSALGFCNIASSKETARRVVFEGIESKMLESPYFRNDFYPKRKTKEEIVFPKNIQIIAGSSTDTSIIGTNIFGGIMDEANFVRTASNTASAINLSSAARARNMQKAMRLYTSIMRRMKSRFNAKGKLPGILCVLSSKTTTDSFTETIINRAQADQDRHMFIRDRSLIDVKRDQFAKETFKVLVGNESYPSRILDQGEDERQFGRNALIVEVPEDLRKDFEENIEESLRDMLGVSTVAISSFMSRVDLVEKMRDLERTHPFTCALHPTPSEWDSRLPYRIHWEKLARLQPNGEWTPIRDPDSPRVVHLDPASTGDAFGLAIAHISHYVKVDGSDEELPVYDIDFMLRIKGEVGAEVLFKNVRQLIYEFSNHGFHITSITSDTYQSREMIQALDSKGYKAEVLSVDTDKEPYRFLRSIVYDERLKCYDYPVLFHELKNLEENPLKIDHRPLGCFTGETRIPTLDGKFPTIAELDGKETWVYSCKTDGTIVPGRARGRMTKMTTELVDVVLDSGAVARCTPEHRWMMRDGSYKEAKDLVPGVDRLMPIRQSWPVNGGYERISNSRGDEVLTHHMVIRHTTGSQVPKGKLVHHINGDKTDNRPENLELSDYQEHGRYHTAERHRTDAEYSRRVREGAQRFNLSVDGRRKHAASMRRTLDRMTPADHRRKLEKREFFRHDITIDSLTAAANNGATNANRAAFMLECGRNVVVRVLKDHGFATWDAFAAAKAGQNHKVRAVIPVTLDIPVPVYDLEVDDWHNFALAAGVFVHNSKDIADAVCGAIWQLHKLYRNRQPNLPVKGISVAQVPDRQRFVVDDELFAADERKESEVAAIKREEIQKVQQIAKQVWPKKPQTVAPTYRKKKLDGTVQDLKTGEIIEPDDLLMRG